MQADAGPLIIFQPLCPELVAVRTVDFQARPAACDNVDHDPESRNAGPSACTGVLRRLSVQLIRRFLIAILFLCLGCAAQANSPEVNRRIERQVRVYWGEKIPPSVNVTVGPRTSSTEFPSYDKVVVTLSHGDRKQDIDFLVSKDGASLVRVVKFDISKDPYAEVMKKIDLSGRPVRGAKDAKVTIVNFDDFECPFCSHMHTQLMQGVLKMYGDRVRIVYKDFPLAEIHPWAIHAAVNANCLAAQSSDAYWQFADYAHANQKQITGGEQKPPFTQQFAALDKSASDIAQRLNLQVGPLQACLKAQSTTAVLASMQEGLVLGISATPSVFVNGERVDGAVPMTELQAMINRALRDAGQPIPTAALVTPEPESPPKGSANAPPTVIAAPAANAAPATNAPPAPK
jgi:protein-disulfide isomerase